MIKCVHCGSENVKIIETPNMIHFGKLECQDCNRFNKWIIKPKNEGIRTKTSKCEISDILNFHKMEKEFCFFCLRTRKQLGFSETLTIDHIEELDKGGDNGIENLQILCSSCHKLKNWTRLYINWHLEKFYKREDKID